jgi:hypothetical protein
MEACLDLATLNCTKLLKETAQCAGSHLFRHCNYYCTADFENEGYFFAGKLYNGALQGILLRTRGQLRSEKSRGPFEISREMLYYVVCPNQKIAPIL